MFEESIMSKLSESSREEIEAELATLFNYASSFREQYDTKAIEWYQQYVGYRERPKGSTGSNLHIPRTYEQIDSLRAKLVKSFFTTRPYIDFLPLPGGNLNPELLKVNEIKAKLAGALVDLQLEKNQIYSRFYEFVTNFLIFPAAIMSVGWRYETKQVKRKVPAKTIIGVPQPSPMGSAYGSVVVPQMVEIPGEFVVEEQAQVVWDDNELQVVDFFDFWIDPRARDLDSARFVIQREWMTWQQLQDKLQIFQEAGTGEIYPLKKEEVDHTSSGLNEGKYERLSSIGLTPETSDGGKQAGSLYEVLWFWWDERVCLWVNRKRLVYDGANPYWRHSKKPFVMAVFEPLPNEIYGLSAVQIISDLQEELNTHRNQRIDNVSLILNRMWLKKRSADVDEAELVSRPNGIINVDSLDDLQEMAINDVTGSAYQEEAIIKSDMENVIATPAVVRGSSGANSETATEIVTKNTNAGIRYEVKILLYESLALRRLAELMDMNNQQFLEESRLVKLFGEESVYEWQLVEPGDILGEHDYRPAGSNTDPTANKEIRRQQLTNLLQICANNQYVKQYDLLKMLFESYDIKNPDQLLYTPEELQVMQMQAMQTQMMAQGNPGMNPMG